MHELTNATKISIISLFLWPLKGKEEDSQPKIQNNEFADNYESLFKW